MNHHTLELPERAPKPRSTGLTMMIDGGLPPAYFDDVIDGGAPYLDFVKFGWGTAIVTDALEHKIETLRSHGIEHYFGGTLFEKFLLQGKIDEFREFCRRYSCHYVEVSNGTIDLSDSSKADAVRTLSDEFRVISEVGFKDPGRSDLVPASRWRECVAADLDAGACLVTLETRESGRSGICTGSGDLRHDIVHELLHDGELVDHLLFEAPTVGLQSTFIRLVGPDVNLGNIPATGVLGLETLRLGLRSDTLTRFEGAPSLGAAASGITVVPALR
jgi:phosphosulfolactate synthase